MVKSTAPEVGVESPGYIRRIRRLLLGWGRRHFRPFTWRTDRDLYRTLVTEVLLKQTTAERTVAVRSDLLRTYPTAHALALATPIELKEVIASLGFGKQRTAQLIALGRALSEGRVHRSVSALLALPGVGPYTAGAAACFAWGRAEPALDVNVARIIVRVFGIEVAKGEPRRHHRVQELARRLVTGPYPRNMNWTLLDLGATVCRPRPSCDDCPLADVCLYSLRTREGITF